MGAGRAVVLGGGGLAGIAWMTGMLAAWEAAGLTPARDADTVVGTSAGSTVAAQATNRSPSDIYAGLTGDAPTAEEISPGRHSEEQIGALLEIMSQVPPPPESELVDYYFAVPVDDSLAAARREVIRQRCAGCAWRPGLVITALSRRRRARVTFDQTTGVPLADAVAASCAVPGLWPHVTVGGDDYIDGGMLSSTNADLAAGADPILVLQPDPRPDDLFPEAEKAARAGALIVRPDERSWQAAGSNPLDPAVRPACARAGYAQGELSVDRVRAYWG
ncbi:patatin-like phospholipase family protein [Tsukamurella soli]|uniref:Patatin-like phospholipase family protein n=1 Tax=Tsukamurella soli TaxID=644556 RepID=A0ABP8J7N2_9ACTN